MALGGLNIEVSANFARFASDMGKVAQIAETNAKKIDNVLGVVSTGLKSLGAGFAIGLSLETVKGKIDAAISAAAGLQQLAERTGATVENLSGLAAVAKLSGTDTDALATGLQKLAKSMVDAEGGGQKTAAAFNAIGISTKELKGLRPDEAFLLISNRLATYADGAEKTAIAQALLGKAGANLLPVMTDLADVGEYQIKTTTEQAKAADDYEKNLKRLGAAQSAIYKIVANEVVPVLDAFTKALLQSATETGGVRDQAAALAKDGSIRSWAEDAVKVVGFVVDAFQGAVRVIQITGQAIGATLAAAEIIWNSNLKQMGPRLKELQANYFATVDAIAQKPLFSDKLAKQLEAARAPQEAAVTRPRIKVPDAGAADTAASLAKKVLEGALKAQEDYIAQEKTLLASREGALAFYRNLDYTTLRDTETAKQQVIADSLAVQLQAYDKEAAAIAIYIAKSTKLSDKQDGQNRLADVAKKRAAAETEANAKISASEQALFAVQRQFDLATTERDRQAGKGNAQAAFQISLLGQTTLAVAKANAARQIELDLEERIYQVRRLDPTADVSAAIAAAEKQKADALALVESSYDKQRTAAFGAQEAFRKYAEEAGNTAAGVESALTNAFKGAEDALVSFVRTGKLDFKSLADSIITDLIRIQVKALLGGAAGGAGGNGGWLAGLFSSFKYSGSSGDNTAGNYVSGVDQGFSLLATGTNYVPYDGMQAVLHKGEAVVPAAYNPAAGGGTGGPVVNVHVETPAGYTGKVSQQQNQNGGVDLKVQVLEMVAHDISSGGVTNDALQRRFQLNAGGSTPRY